MRSSSRDDALFRAYMLVLNLVHFLLFSDLIVLAHEIGDPNGTS